MLKYLNFNLCYIIITLLLY